MSYAVKSMFCTLQGEGFHVGRAAVFCRFAGCNLWSGRPGDRIAARCSFCDTDFVGTDGARGGRYTASEVAEVASRLWEGATQQRFIVLTGGEPLLQVDAALCDELHQAGFYIAVETNGTLAVPSGVDWVCVSPKTARIAIAAADELKLVFPQSAVQPSDVEWIDVKHRFLQPMDGSEQPENALRAARYCRKNPNWRLSVQVHKYVGFE